MVARERSVWLNITGVPLQVWKEDFFRTVVSMVGKFLNIDESTQQKLRLDVVRVFATISMSDAVNRVVRILINEKVHLIRFVEDVFRNSVFNLGTDRVVPASDEGSSQNSES